MQTTKFLRKPLSVEAVQVTEGNMAQIAEWANGTLYTDVLDPAEWYIDIKVIHPLRRKECRAHIGEWILKSKQGFKIYSDRAFQKGFEPAWEDPEVKNPIEPTAEQIIENMTCICGHPEIDEAVHSDSFPCYSNEVVEVPQSLGFQ
jgi:hypothetical protein